MIETVRRWVPLVHEAFAEHVLGGVKLSATAWSAIRRMLNGEALTEQTSGLGKREWRELMAALGRG